MSSKLTEDHEMTQDLDALPLPELVPDFDVPGWPKETSAFSHAAVVKLIRAALAAQQSKGEAS